MKSKLTIGVTAAVTRGLMKPVMAANEFEMPKRIPATGGAIST